MRIFNSNVSNVKSVLLCGSETRRMAEKNLSKLQTFINRCLHRILRVYWSYTISNVNLWKITEQASLTQQIMNRKSSWIGHTLRKPSDWVLWWNPQGKRRRDRLRNSWRSNTERIVASKYLDNDRFLIVTRELITWEIANLKMCQEKAKLKSQVEWMA